MGSGITADFNRHTVYKWVHVVKKCVNYFPIQRFVWIDNPYSGMGIGSWKETRFVLAAEVVCGCHQGEILDDVGIFLQ